MIEERKRWSFMLVLTVILATGFLVSAPEGLSASRSEVKGDEGSREHSPSAFRSESDLRPVSIMLSTPQVVLEPRDPMIDASKMRGILWGAQGELSIRAYSWLPEWGVSVRALPPTTQDRMLPADRFWARTEVTGEAPVSLDEGVPVLVGDLRLPERETSFEIGVDPDWSDRPGRYKGTLVVAPFLPGGKGASAVLGSGNQPLGSGEVVTVHFDIPELLLISPLRGEIAFTTDLGPGTYSADSDVRFNVTTNASSWRVECHAKLLTSDRGEIPSERIEWERVDQLGRRLSVGTVGEHQTVVLGTGPCKDLEVRLRFKVDVRPEDIAGEYKGEFSFVGFTGN